MCENLVFSSDAFRNIDIMPSLKPPVGFRWQFMAKTWVMIPEIVDAQIGGDCSTESGKDIDRSDVQSLDKVTHETKLESDDSSTEF